MLSIEHEEPVFDESGEYVIRFGVSQWSPDEHSFAFAWRDRNGAFSRGTVKEIPIEALEILYKRAVKLGYIE